MKFRIEILRSGNKMHNRVWSFKYIGDSLWYGRHQMFKFLRASWQRRPYDNEKDLYIHELSMLVCFGSQELAMMMTMLLILTQKRCLHKIRWHPSRNLPSYQQLRRDLQQKSHNRRKLFPQLFSGNKKCQHFCCGCQIKFSDFPLLDLCRVSIRIFISSWMFLNI